METRTNPHQYDQNSKSLAFNCFFFYQYKNPSSFACCKKIGWNFLCPSRSCSRRQHINSDIVAHCFIKSASPQGANAWQFVCFVLLFPVGFLAYLFVCQSSVRQFESQRNSTETTTCITLNFMLFPKHCCQQSILQLVAEKIEKKNPAEI